MSPSKLPNIGRYILVIGAGILLAPYAGCHILTSPPLSTRELSHDESSVDDEPNGYDNTAHEEVRQEPLPSGSRSQGRDNLDDIEKLLTP